VPSDFDIALTERYPGQISEIAIKPGDPCRARVGDDPVITGHVDRLQPSIDARRHAPRLQGRGKCADPVDTGGSMRIGPADLAGDPLSL